MKKRNYVCICIVTTLLIIGIGMAFLTRDEKSYDPTKTVVVTIDNEQIYLDEVLYHLTLSRMQGQLYAAFMNDTDYMKKDYGDGRTIGEVMKQESMDNAIRYELLYQQAVKEGYVLTEDEIADSKKKAENILVTIPKDDQKKTGLTQEKLVSIQEKITLAVRYYKTIYDGTDLTDQEVYEQIKEGHKITIQKKVWNSVSF
jgi:foldase protein PrsA